MWAETPLLVLFRLYFFSLHQAKKDANGVHWQQVTSQTLTKFIKKILKHVPLTSETTFKCTIFIQLEETLKPNLRPFSCLIWPQSQCKNQHWFSHRTALLTTPGFWCLTHMPVTSGHYLQAHLVRSKFSLTPLSRFYTFRTLHTLSCK